MVLPVSVLLFAGALLYAGLHNMSVTDVFRQLLGRQPTGQLGNLAGNTSTPSGTPGTSPPGTGAAIAAAAMAQVARTPGSYTYAEVRPIPRSFSGHVITDCSGFAILCYKSAGAPDPSGNNYNGSGWTGDLQQHGRAVHSAMPGDLAFWQNPDHVGVVVGTGTDPRVAEFGGGNKPGFLKVSLESHYHARFIGFRRYL